MAGGRQRRHMPPSAAEAAEAQVRQSFESTAVRLSPLSWWFVTWRARVIDDSTANIDAHLDPIADAMERLDGIGGQPWVRRGSSSRVTFEFWFEAANAREAAGGARIALRHACRAAGVGDPNPQTNRPAAVRLMFEELPTLHRDDTTRQDDR